MKTHALAIQLLSYCATVHLTVSTIKLVWKFGMNLGRSQNDEQGKELTESMHRSQRIAAPHAMEIAASFFRNDQQALGIRAAFMRTHSFSSSLRRGTNVSA